MKIEAVVRRKTQDLVRDAAEDLLRETVEGIRRVDRAELWTFEVGGGDAREPVRAILDDTALVVNPNVHRYSLVAAPDGMTIDPDSGAVRWTPVAAQLGDHPVGLEVVDSGGLSATQSFVVSVSGLNQPPLVTSVPDTKAQGGNHIYQYRVEAADPEGDWLRFSLEAQPAFCLIYYTLYTI